MVRGLAGTPRWAMAQLSSAPWSPKMMAVASISMVGIAWGAGALRLPVVRPPPPLLPRDARPVRLLSLLLPTAM